MMNQRLRRTAAAWIAAAVLFSIPAQAEPAVSAESAVLIDAASGRVLWANRASERALIASTTKIMTGLLIAELTASESLVTITDEAAGMEGSSLYLQAGDTLSAETLLYGMMLHSGNDAAAALAIHTAGSIPAFVDIMNRKAAALGLENTHFSNPHGLDDEDHYSTALDLAKLTAYAMDNTLFRNVVSTKTISCGDRTFVNHNKLLWNYEGAVGVKTGYTRKAGRILVSCAERDGRRLIAVTINAPDDWNDHRRMLDYGFQEYEQVHLVKAGETLATVPLMNGTKAYGCAAAAEDCFYPVHPMDKVSIQCQIKEFEYAPVLAGGHAGQVLIMINGEPAAQLPLYWKSSVWECG